MFELRFKTDNAAFVEGGEAEAARILRHIADAVERGCIMGPAVDSNGNTVGEWMIDLPEAD